MLKEPGVSRRSLRLDKVGPDRCHPQVVLRLAPGIGAWPWLRGGAFSGSEQERCLRRLVLKLVLGGDRA